MGGRWECLHEREKRADEEGAQRFNDRLRRKRRLCIRRNHGRRHIVCHCVQLEEVMPCGEEIERVRGRGKGAVRAQALKSAVQPYIPVKLSKLRKRQQDSMRTAKPL